MLTYKFVEGGGYDCMTDAFNIEDDSLPEDDRLIAVIDLGNFGQLRCKPRTLETVRIAEEYARRLIGE